MSDDAKADFMKKHKMSTEGAENLHRALELTMRRYAEYFPCTARIELMATSGLFATTALKYGVSREDMVKMLDICLQFCERVKVE